MAFHSESQAQDIEEQHQWEDAQNNHKTISEVDTSSQDLVESKSKVMIATMDSFQNGTQKTFTVGEDLHATVIMTPLDGQKGNKSPKRKHEEQEDSNDVVEVPNAKQAKKNPPNNKTIKADESNVQDNNAQAGSSGMGNGDGGNGRDGNQDDKKTS
ncbi:hypothetical protein AC249_AIPGENE28773 [Exaiptasia diaphana]|nr:hypothetical protein AC249_AIPGENE28773 [Exaiptasia diaphana]